MSDDGVLDAFAIRTMRLLEDGPDPDEIKLLLDSHEVLRGQRDYYQRVYRELIERHQAEIAAAEARVAELETREAVCRDAYAARTRERDALKVALCALVDSPAIIAARVLLDSLGG